MKKTLLLLMCCCSLFTIKAQESDETEQNFNEIKLNGLYLVLGAFDITYERTINEESAFGVSLFLPFDDDINENFNFYASPYYRFYFGKKYAAGFFVEGFSLLSSYKTSEFFINDDVDINRENELAFALGIGVGGKWITKSGFVGELGLGIGRNIFNSDEFDDIEIVGKINISVGYRF